MSNQIQLDTDDAENRLFKCLVWGSVLLTFVTVVLSAHIRLSVNGLGCTGWPHCYGHIGSPELYTPMDSFGDANVAKPYGLARAAHRLVASTLGFFLLVLLVQSLRRRVPEAVGVFVPVWAFSVTVFLAVIGYLTPSPWLPVIALSNLMGGMMLLALVWWIARAGIDSGVVDSKTSSPGWVVVGLVLLTVQIGLGAWTSANFSGPACETLFGCGGQPLALSQFAESFSLFRELTVDQHGKVLLDGNSVLINTAHRVGAVITSLYLGLFAVFSIVSNVNVRHAAFVLLTLLGIQLGVGILVVTTGFPLLVATLHNAISALLLIVLVEILRNSVGVKKPGLRSRFLVLSG